MRVGFFNLKKILFLCLASGSISGISSQSTELAHILGYVLPKTAEFIATFLNITEDQVQDLADTLFDYTVDPDDVNILQFKNNGQYTSREFGGDEIDIDLSQEIVIIIHGYRSQGTAGWVQEMVTAYQEKGIQNTLAIDWSNIAKQDYFTAVTAIKNIGEIIAARLYDEILNRDDSAVENIHLIGHSLGAHIAGFIGSTIYNKTGYLINRITGLDAAAPLLEYPLKLPASRRLDKSDASYVDAYHTCAGFMGFLSEIGHQDFYINSGFPVQPGCKESDIIKSIVCSHQSVYGVFTNTINSDDYVARKCDRNILAYLGRCHDNGSVIMGDNNNGTDIEGKFYAETDAAGNPL